MSPEQKVRKMEALLAQSADFKAATGLTSTFIAWKDETERTIQKIFGPESFEAKKFKGLTFRYHPGIWIGGEDYSREERAAFLTDLQIAVKSIENYLQDLREQIETPTDSVSEKNASNEADANVAVKKVFVSHASKDLEYVEELVELLKLMGLQKGQIFCTSVKGYGVPLGANFLNEIKERVSDDVLVLFVFSRNFYASPVCLAEMGAAWAFSKDHVPVVIPPFSFRDIEGVLPHTQGLMINDELGVNELASKIENLFGLESHTQNDDWERSRDRIIKRINRTIADEATAKSSPPKAASKGLRTSAI